MWFFNFQNLVRTRNHIGGTPCIDVCIRTTWYLFANVCTQIQSEVHDLLIFIGLIFLRYSSVVGKVGKVGKIDSKCLYVTVTVILCNLVFGKWLHYKSWQDILIGTGKKTFNQLGQCALCTEVEFLAKNW